MVKVGEILIASADSNNAEIKALFNRQWINGDIEKFMGSVRRRVKEAYDIDLNFKDRDEFVDELKRHGLIQIIDKP